LRAESDTDMEVDIRNILGVYRLLRLEADRSRRRRFFSGRTVSMFVQWIFQGSGTPLWCARGERESQEGPNVEI